MTREEAIANVESKIKRIKQIMDEGDMGCVDMENWENWATQLEYQEMIITALRGPVPDDMTGMVNHGEERAILWCTVGQGFWVSCGDIAQTKRYETEELAKSEWNKAHGYTP